MNRRAFTLPEVFAGIIAFAVIAAIAWGYESFACSARWDGTGFSSRYRCFGGCQVQDEGKWIPEKNFRK